MAKIRWKVRVKLWNRAIGLPGPDVTRPLAGTEMDVPDSALKTLAERYGENTFDVISKPKTKPKTKPKVPPKKGGKR